MQKTLTRSRDFGSREDRARNPVKGLRQKLRIALRQLGVVGKFRTDEHRTKTLFVIGNLTEIPITEFQGRKVKLIQLPKARV